MDDYLRIDDDRLLHVRGVGERAEELSHELFDWNEEKCREMFVLGYLHDVGYQYSRNQPQHEGISGVLITNVSESSKDAARRLEIAQKEIGILSQFITHAFMATRNLEHRAKHNELVAGSDELVAMAEKHVQHVRRVIEEDRRMLETASGLLANTAQSVQAVVNQEHAAISERTNTFLTYASAIFFIPTLIISFFSMSIIGFNKNDAVPSTLFVFLLCLTSVMVALILLLLFRVLLTRSRQKKSSKEGGSLYV